MKFAILFTIILFAGCQNPKQSSNEHVTDAANIDSTIAVELESPEVDTTSVTQIEEIDLNDTVSQPLGLATLADFRKNGAKRTTKMNDSLFMEFLKSFTTYQNSTNDILFKHPKHEIWNTIAYSPNGEISPEAINFQDSVKEMGFVVASSEGSIFLDKDPEFLNRFSQYLSDRMNAFLVEYNEDILNPYAEDNSIIISRTEHIRRMLFWEDFSKKNPDFELPDYANNQFRSLLFLFMLGTGNSAIHDWGTPPRIRTDIHESFVYVIDQHPNSTAAEYLKDYLNFLEQQSFIWDRVPFHQYGREKFPDRYSN